MITCGLDVIEVYNTYFSHQNVCLSLLFEIFTHSWIRYTVSGTPKKHEDERYCMSFRRKYFHHWKHKYFDHWLNKYFDHWSRKILGWRQDFLRWEQLWPEAPILKPSRISCNSTIVILKQRNHSDTQSRDFILFDCRIFDRPIVGWC